MLMVSLPRTFSHLHINITLTPPSASTDDKNVDKIRINNEKFHEFLCSLRTERQRKKKCVAFCHSNWFSVEAIVLLCNFPFSSAEAKLRVWLHEVPSRRPLYKTQWISFAKRIRNKNKRTEHKRTEHTRRHCSHHIQLIQAALKDLLLALQSAHCA